MISRTIPTSVFVAFAIVSCSAPRADRGASADAGGDLRANGPDRAVDSAAHDAEGAAGVYEAMEGIASSVSASSEQPTMPPAPKELVNAFLLEQHDGEVLDRFGSDAASAPTMSLAADTEHEALSSAVTNELLPAAAAAKTGEIEIDRTAGEPTAQPPDAPTSHTPARVLGRVVPQVVASQNLLGAAVRAPDDAELGIVKDLLVDPRTGELLRVVVHASGSDVELPWRTDAWAETADGCVLVLSPAELGRRALDIDIRRLFQGRELERLDGSVLSVEADPSASTAGRLVLKLREPDNRFHRVLLGQPDELAALRDELAPEKRIEVRGLFTRDALGALFVASSISTPGGGEWKRSEAASTATVAPRAAACSLSGPYVRTPGDEALELAGFFVDYTESPARVETVALRVAGDLRLVPWAALSFDEERGWSVPIDRGDLELYPPLRVPSAALH